MHKRESSGLLTQESIQEAKCGRHENKLTSDDKKGADNPVVRFKRDQRQHVTGVRVGTLGFLFILRVGGAKSVHGVSS